MTFKKKKKKCNNVGSELEQLLKKLKQYSVFKRVSATALLIAWRPVEKLLTVSVRNVALKAPHFYLFILFFKDFFIGVFQHIYYNYSIEN